MLSRQGNTKGRTSSATRQLKCLQAYGGEDWRLSQTISEIYKDLNQKLGRRDTTKQKWTEFN